VRGFVRGFMHKVTAARRGAGWVRHMETAARLAWEDEVREGRREHAGGGGGAAGRRHLVVADAAGALL